MKFFLKFKVTFHQTLNQRNCSLIDKRLAIVKRDNGR